MENCTQKACRDQNRMLKLNKKYYAVIQKCIAKFMSDRFEVENHFEMTDVRRVEFLGINHRHHNTHIIEHCYRTVLKAGTKIGSYVFPNDRTIILFLCQR